MNAAEFLERAGPSLLADEARHNLLLGIAGNVRDLPHLFPEAHFWVVDGAAAMQTPPWNVVIAKPRDRTSLAALVEAIDVDLPGVTAALPEVEDFVELWGRPAELARSDNIWALHELVPPPPMAGAPREATHDDLELGRHPDPERDPHRARLHAGRATRQRLHGGGDRRRLAAAARARAVLFPLHRRDEHGGGTDLRPARVHAGLRVAPVRVQVTPHGSQRHRAVDMRKAEQTAEHAAVIGTRRRGLYLKRASGASWPRPCRP